MRRSVRCFGECAELFGEIHTRANDHGGICYLLICVSELGWSLVVRLSSFANPAVVLTVLSDLKKAADTSDQQLSPVAR